MQCCERGHLQRRCRADSRRWKAGGCVDIKRGGRRVLPVAKVNLELCHHPRSTAHLLRLLATSVWRPTSSVNWRVQQRKLVFSSLGKPRKASESLGASF